MALSTVAVSAVCRRLGRERLFYGGVINLFNGFHEKSRFKSSFYGGDTPFRRAHAQELIVRMSAAERSILLEELQSFEKAAEREHQQQTTSTSANDLHVRPSFSQLRGVATLNAIPFIGFGFLDNFIMIVAGDYLDMTIGVTLGISTMAAAALGNLISDVAGLGSAWYVESLSAKVGIKAPVLTPEQLSMGSTTWSIYLVRVGFIPDCLFEGDLLIVLCLYRDELWVFRLDAFWECFHFYFSIVLKKADKRVHDVFNNHPFL